MIGILDVGGTKLLAAVSADGQRLGEVVRRETPRADPIPALIQMLDSVRGGEKLDGIAMAVPGPFDRTHPRLLNPPGMPEAWHQLDLQTHLGDHYGCRVIAENDANCSALGEATKGAGVGHSTLVYFTVSTGIGTGVVRNGRVQINRNDTEGGHQVLWPGWLGGPDCHCGGAGCLEALASGTAIQRRFGVRAEHLDDQAAWDEVGSWLGLAIVNATALIDPDVVVLGGGVTASWDRFAPALHRTVQDSLHLQPQPTIARAQLSDGMNNLLGALANLVTTLEPSDLALPG